MSRDPGWAGRIVGAVTVFGTMSRNKLVDLGLIEPENPHGPAEVSDGKLFSPKAPTEPGAKPDFVKQDDRGWIS